MDDKLKERLREDAAAIDVEVSAALDARIRASLAAAPQEPPRVQAPRRPAFKLWWASSLTGAAVAAVVILLINLKEPAPQADVRTAHTPPALTPQLTVKSAVLTEPLEKELENLESDLRKAEEAVRKDIDLFP